MITEYMRNRTGVENLQVDFDEDGTIHIVGVYSDVLDSYLSVEIDKIPESDLERIQKFVNNKIEEIGPNPEPENAA